jgi:NADPH:quinone reductase-like Zn-dependent oxidoreductase
MEESGLRPEKGPVIVTGATGGVGSLAVDMLAKSGYHVVALTGKARRGITCAAWAPPRSRCARPST